MWSISKSPGADIPKHMNWYFIDQQGVTKGPVTISEMQSMYGSTIKDTTYVWNGESVPKWTPITGVPELTEVFEMLTKLRARSNTEGTRARRGFTTSATKG